MLINSPSAVSALNIDGVWYPLGGLIQLTAFCAANGGFSTFKKAGETTGATHYTPSGTNKFYFVSIMFGIQNTTLDGRIGYGDTSVGYNSALAPTNPVVFGATIVNNYASAPIACYTGTANTYKSVPFNAAVPNGKYPFVVWGNNTSTVGNYGAVYAWGYEGA